MKKILVLLISLLFTVGCQGNTQVINPSTSISNKKEAEERAGMTITLPESFKVVNFVVIENEQIEVLDDKGTSIRKSINQMSQTGDYTEYSMAELFENHNAMIKGDNDIYYFASFEKEGYYYSVYSEEGYSRDVILEYINEIQ